MARRRLTTVPGSDPLVPAAQRRPSTVHPGHPVATAPEPERPIWRWPKSRHVHSENSLASRSRRAPDFTPHPESPPLLLAKNDCVSRPFGVRAEPMAPSAEPSTGAVLTPETGALFPLGTMQRS